VGLLSRHSWENLTWYHSYLIAISVSKSWKFANNLCSSVYIFIFLSQQQKHIPLFGISSYIRRIPYIINIGTQIFSLWIILFTNVHIDIRFLIIGCKNAPSRLPLDFTVNLILSMTFSLMSVGERLYLVLHPINTAPWVTSIFLFFLLWQAFSNTVGYLLDG